MYLQWLCLNNHRGTQWHSSYKHIMSKWSTKVNLFTVWFTRSSKHGPLLQVSFRTGKDMVSFEIWATLKTMKDNSKRILWRKPQAYYQDPWNKPLLGHFWARENPMCSPPRTEAPSPHSRSVNTTYLVQKNKLKLLHIIKAQQSAAITVCWLLFFLYNLFIINSGVSQRKLHKNEWL